MPVDSPVDIDRREFACLGHGLYTMPTAWLNNPPAASSTSSRSPTPGGSGDHGLPSSRERIAEHLLTPWPEETRPSLYGDLSFGFSSTSTTTTESHRSNFKFKGYECDDEERLLDIFRRSLSFGVPACPATPPAMAAPPSYDAPVETTPKESYKDRLRKQPLVDYFPTTRLRSATSRSLLCSPRKTPKALPIKANATKEASTTSH